MPSGHLGHEDFPVGQVTCHIMPVDLPDEQWPRLIVCQSETNTGMQFHWASKLKRVDCLKGKLEMQTDFFSSPVKETIVTFSCLLFCLMYRHILASLHFNENVLRQTKKTDAGKESYKVTYPKFKLGEEVVRELTVPPTYGKHCIHFSRYVG